MYKRITKITTKVNKGNSNMKCWNSVMNGINERNKYAHGRKDQIVNDM